MNEQLEAVPQRKTRLYYNRLRTISDTDMEQILLKDPQEMTENEKVLWKVEVFRQCEDTEDYLKQKMQDIKVQRIELKNVIEESKSMVQQFQDAVDRIGKRVEIIKK